MARSCDRCKMLRDLMDERDRRYGVQFANARDAVMAASKDMDRRLEAMNEFRAQLEEQAKTFMPRPEFTAEHKALEAKVDGFEAALGSRIWTLERRDAERGGTRIGQTAMWGYIVGAIGAIGIIASLISLFVHFVVPGGGNHP